MSAKQPLINRKMQLRLALGLFVIAALYAGRQIVVHFLQDPDTGTIQSSNWISAIQDTNDGSVAVIIKPDGSVIQAPGYSNGEQDQQVAWQPDGNRIYFSSNREGENQAFHIYRWNPAHDVVQRRSIGSRSQSNPTFPFDNVKPGEQEMLTISGGLVVTLDPRTGNTHQMLPLVGRDPTTVAQSEGGGIGSQFGPEYDNLGNSFRIAMWANKKNFIAGVLEKESGGETLIYQNMNPALDASKAGEADKKAEDDMKPHPMAAADHIDFCIDPNNGEIVFSAENWQWPDGTPIPPQFMKGNKVLRPYNHMVGFYNPATGKGGLIVASNSDKVAFAQPQVSPDGTKVIVVLGTYKDGGVTSEGLMVAPLTEGGGASGTPIFRGPAYNPHWSPDGSTIVFIEQNPGGKNDVCTIGSDGSGFKDITNGSANFGDPAFSPQTANSGSKT